MPHTPIQRLTRSNINSNSSCTAAHTTAIRDIIKDELNAFKKEFRDELKKEISTTLTDLLREELRVLKQEVSEQRQEIDDLKKSLSAINTSNGDFSEKIMNEMTQRFHKREYLIFAGVPEATSGSAEERKKSDSNFIVEVAQHLGCDDLLPEEVSRLGKMLPNKPRLLRIKCQPNNTRALLLRKAKQLCSTQKFKRVYISPDLTQMQREQQHNLRKELIMRRNQGESVKILKGQIVPADQRKQPSHFR